MNIPNKKNWFSILVDFNSVGKGAYEHSSYSYFTKFIPPQIKNYLSFEESLVEYSKINKDMNQSKPVTSRELHLIFLTLISMKSTDEVDSHIFLKNLTMINEKLKSKNNNLYSSRLSSGVSHSQFLKFYEFCCYEFYPICSFFGALVANEAIKFCGKYYPLDQWLHFEVFELFCPNMIIIQPQDSSLPFLTSKFKGNLSFKNIDSTK